jgi:hypothetical protein
MRLDKEALLDLLESAFAELSDAQARGVFGGAIDLATVCEPPRKQAGQLLDEIKRFHARALSGHYYEDFAVNSKNFMQKSEGTQIWIAEMNRLFSKCTKASRAGQHAEARASFELLFDLMSQVDECRDDIVFFADEGGSWQVGADFDEILPAYFASLAEATQPDQYAQRVLAIIREHVSHDRDKYLRLARRTLGKSGTQHEKALLALAPVPHSPASR